MSQQKGRESQGAVVREILRELPERPSLEHLKSHAKDLLEGVRAGVPVALERVRRSLPAARFREARAAYAAQRDLTSRLRHVIALFP